jgi:hypothetical protein
MPLILDAFPVSNTANWTLEPCKGSRDWMDASIMKFAYRCLPLVMANQAGWLVTCPVNFSMVWNGGQDRTGLSLHFPQGEGANAGQIRSHFGMGIVTFSMPWLFRTSPGYGIWARGPANMPRDGIAPLDGIVETDWAPYTFTMNWKVTRPNFVIEFKKGDPVALIVPFPLNYLEEVEPRERPIESDATLAADYDAFNRGRSAALAKLATTSEAVWSMDYMKGHRPDGTTVTEHRKAFKLKEVKK